MSGPMFMPFGPTPGAGAGDTPAVRTLFVGKHGDDANSGTTQDNAFLTFGAALTAAGVLVPAEDDPVVVVCEDAGVYTENLTPDAYVQIFAPAATLAGSSTSCVLTMTDGGVYYFKQINYVAPNTAGVQCAISKSAGDGEANLQLEKLAITGGGGGAGNLTVGLLNSSGTVNFHCENVEVLAVSDGYGIGDNTTDQGHTHVHIGHLHLSSNNVGLACIGAAAVLSGSVDHIHTDGSGTTNIGIYAAASALIALFVRIIECDTAYSITGAATELDLIVGSLTGTETVVSGTANVTIAGAGGGGGGGMVPLGTVSAADVGTLDINSVFDDTYESYLIVGSNLALKHSGPTNLTGRVSSDGGSTWKQGASDYRKGSGSYNNFNLFWFCRPTTLYAMDRVSFRIRITTRNLYATLMCVVAYINQNSTGTQLDAVQYQHADSFDSIQFYFAAGTILSGSITVYGLLPAP